MDCLNNIIKLSRTECPCFDSDKPETAGDGKSPVYLDEIEGLNLSIIESASDCEQGSLWNLMDRARENAITSFKADLLSCIEGDYIPKRPNYKGIIGQTTFNSSLNITQTMAGVSVVFPKITGGKMIINRIAVMINNTQNLTVRVYNNDENKTTPIAEYIIPATADTTSYGVLTTPLELPMWSNNVHNLEYYFVYERSGFLPKNNKSQCIPCSGGAKVVTWANWLSLRGIKGNDTSFSSFNKQDELMGIALDVELKCEGARVICSDDYPIDFETGYGLQMAYAVRFKAAALLIDSILSSPQINRYTMMDREALYGKRASYRSTYDEWIVYLCKNTPIINNDCWVCKPNRLMQRGTILS